VWNPGRYGEAWHALFRRTYPPDARPIMLFGLNPGPYGMAQSGIPFTDLRRLVSGLPRLALRLERRFGPLRPPGLAPRSLRPFLTRTFESSAVRVHHFLATACGSPEAGFRRVVVANPCPLLFIDPRDGGNRTPADLRRALRAVPDGAALLGRVDLLRRRAALDAVTTLRPRACVLLGRDVDAVLGPTLRAALGAGAVIAWEHPARAVPDAWANGLAAALRERGLLAPEAVQPAGVAVRSRR